MTSPSSHPFGYGQPTNNSLGMGTLGLSQNPRNLSGQQFQGRVGGNNSHIPGHVTPTSSGISNFPTCIPNNIPSQQPSPNSRTLMTLGSRGISSQRPLNQDMKRILGVPLGSLPATDDGYNKRDRSVMFNMGGNAISNMTSYGLSHNSRSFATQNMLSSGMQNNSFSTSPVGMVKQPTNESSEFQIHSEDFPALPGSQSQENNQDNMNKSSSGNSLESSKEPNRFVSDKSNSLAQKRGIQTSKDGRVTNIPAGMVTDQFGMVGLLTFIRAAETDPKLVSLALGSDLTTLGLNLNTPENLYPSFGGPWAEHPCRPQDIDYHVPAEYLVNQSIRDKLAPVKLNRYGEDLLFFLFYMFSGDILQVAAAIELYNRDWRFHKDERVWITRVPGMAPAEKTATYERGMYYFFDAENWRKVAKEFHLDYERLEERALLPTSYNYHQTQNMSA